jgi:hypothetical protein
MSGVEAMCLEDDTGHIKSASARFPRGAGAVSFCQGGTSGNGGVGWQTTNPGTDAKLSCSRRNSRLSAILFLSRSRKRNRRRSSASLMGRLQG